MARHTDEQREDAWTVLVRWREQAEVVRGLTPERAREIAQRDVLALLGAVGGRAWFFPKASSVQAPALEGRDEAIRAAHRRGLPVVVVLRTYRISRSHLYRILNGKRSGKAQCIA
jgi:Mor family transcriptional regulator